VIWRCRDTTFELSGRVRVMGIVNVTPDSFSDGGRYLDPDLAIARCHELLAEGADVLDLGAESTRPGSLPVPSDEQWKRLEPVLAALHKARPEAVLSVDTRNASVAERALALGARIVNDVSALSDPAMAGVVARAGAGLVLMHMRGTPENMQRDVAYADITTEVADFLRERLARAEAGGVARECVAFDPGIGFGKSAAGSLELLARLAELVAELKRTLTLVVIEHDMRFLFSLADRLHVIHWGQVIASGTPESLRGNPWVQRSALGTA